MMRFQVPPRADSLNHTPIRHVNNLLLKVIDGKAMRQRGLIVRPSNSPIRCLNLDNAASILVPKTSHLTSRPSCAPDHEVKSLLVYGIQLAPQTKPIPLVNLQ
jgi:hypothetical protein